MKRTAKKPDQQPTLIDKLGDSFIKTFEADFQLHGVEVIEQLRQKAPEKYAEIATRLIAAAEQPASPGDFSRCKSVEDIGRLLLAQVGVLEEAMDEEMIARAISANEDFIAQLRRIGEGH